MKMTQGSIMHEQTVHVLIQMLYLRYDKPVLGNTHACRNNANIHCVANNVNVNCVLVQLGKTRTFFTAWTCT